MLYMYGDAVKYTNEDAFVDGVESAIKLKIKSSLS